MGKFNDVKGSVLKLYDTYSKETNLNFQQITKEIAKDVGIEWDEYFRVKVGRWLAKAGLRTPQTVKSDNDLENETVTETNQYSNGVQSMPSAWSTELNKFLTIEEFCAKYGLNVSSVKSSKLVSHNAGHMTYNIAFFTQEEEAVLNVSEDLETVIKKYISKQTVDTEVLPILNSDTFDRLVFTDVHIGMSVQGNGDPLYDGKWDREELLKRLEVMVNHVANHQRSNILYIDDLGDFLDGLGGETTRKGHHLPQNMNDKEAFDLALEFKILLVETLLESYSFITLNNITEDNHSGVFGYFASSAVKGILETKYPDRVTVNNRKKFIEHYSVGKHTFILCHGKDSESLKFGFKPILDTKQAEKIDQYCKEHKLYNGNYIEFSKGDSHQGIFDDTTSNDFQYYSYPAFSPPSNWVKVNFKNSKSGFRFYNIQYKENIKIAIPYYFK